MQKLFLVASRTWMLFGIVVGVLLFLEGAFRLAEHLKGFGGKRQMISVYRNTGSTNSGFDRYLFEQETHSVESGRMRFAPYTGWEAPPSEGMFYNVTSNSFRKTLGNVEGEGVIHVYMFGGSTLWGWYVADGDTIASSLSRLLNTSTNHDYVVHNCGQPGYNNTQASIRFLQMLEQGQIVCHVTNATIVIFYDGANDTYANVYSPAIVGATISDKVIESKLYIQPAWYSVLLSRSHLLGFLKWRIEGERDTFSMVVPRKEWEHGLQNRPAMPLALAGMRRYENRCNILQAVAEAHGLRIFFFWQPMGLFGDEGGVWVKQCGGEDVIGLSPILVSRLREGYAVATEYIAERDFCVDLTACLNSMITPAYVDWCHTGPEANQKIAECIMQTAFPLAQK